MLSSSRSHPGRVRAVNQDRVLDLAEGGLWAIADGMGGHHAGEMAAACLIEALATLRWENSAYARLADLEAAVEAVNARLFEEARTAGETSGATLVSLLIHQGHFACLWAGDSRAYLLRQGELRQITRDHSLVQSLIDGGALGEAERMRHPGAHVITRAVGAAPRLDLDRRFGPVMAGDRFLLCSDGLTACLQPGEIFDLLADQEPTEAADRMLAAALERAAPDNISLVVIGA